MGGACICHAKRMRHIVSVASLAPPYFPTISNYRHDFRIKVTEYKMCVLILSTKLSKTFFILRRTWRDTVINVKSLHVKYPLFVSDVNESCTF